MNIEVQIGDGKMEETNAMQYAGQLAGIAFAGLMETFVKPVDLQPTTYCTAMWNGRRCRGGHPADIGHGFHSWTDSETGNFGAMWRDGYGGVDIHVTNYGVLTNVDVELDRSPALAEGFMPINRIWGHLVDLTEDQRAWLGSALA